MDKDTSVIPKGMYCYSRPRREGVCPYWKIIKDEGIDVYWCDYLNMGDVGNYIKDGDYDKLLKKYGETEFHNKYPLFLLWDQCKECGENDYTEEELEEMIKDD